MWSYTAPVVASWARARKNGKRHFTAPKHAEAMECHRLHALAARPRGWRTDGVYDLRVSYCPPDGRRRDADRVLSLVIDALCGVAWDDDSDRYLRAVEVRRVVSDGTPLSMERGTTLVVVRRVGDAPVAAKRKRVSR